MTESVSIGHPFVSLKADGIDATVVRPSDWNATHNATYNVGVTGSLPRGIEKRLSERVSVKDFGAVGNGVADDSAAFSLAIAYVNSVGSVTLVIPPGTYNINGPYNITAGGTSIVGIGGSSCTTLNYNSSNPVFVLSSSNPDTTALFFPTIRGITFSNSTAGLGGPVITLKSTTWFVVEDIIILNSYQGIDIRSSGGIIRNIYIQGYPFPVVQSGSFLIRNTVHITAGNVPVGASNVFISDFQLEAHNAIPFTMEAGILFEHSDNTHIENGIVAFCYENIRLKPQGRADVNIQDLFVNDCYLDGGGGSNCAVRITGTAGSGINNVFFRHLTFGGTVGPAAFYCDYASNDIQISGGRTALNVSDVHIETTTGLHINGLQSEKTPVLVNCTEVNETGNVVTGQLQSVIEKTRKMSIAGGPQTTSVFNVTFEQVFTGATVEMRVSGITSGIEGVNVTYLGQLADNGAMVIQTLTNSQFPINAQAFAITTSAAGHVATFKVTSNGVGTSNMEAWIRVTGTYVKVDYA